MDELDEKDKVPVIILVATEEQIKKHKLWPQGGPVPCICSRCKRNCFQPRNALESQARKEVLRVAYPILLCLDCLPLFQADKLRECRVQGVGLRVGIVDGSGTAQLGRQLLDKGQALADQSN